MSVEIRLPDELIAAVDEMTQDRDAFIEEAVRRLLHDAGRSNLDEVDRINEVADDLNREAQDVLEYQVIP